MATVDLTPKGLIQADGTFALQPSDFANLSLFIESVLSSNLNNDAIEAYARAGSRTVQLGGKTFAANSIFLSTIDTYSSIRCSCAVLYETASPMIPVLCAQIAAYASSATTSSYGQIIDTLIQIRNSPTHDGPKALIKSNIADCKTQIETIIQTTTKLFDQFTAFQTDMTIYQVKLASYLATIKQLDEFEKKEMITLKPTSREYTNDQRAYAAGILVESDIQKITTRWEPALTGLQALLTSWGNIKDDLDSVEDSLTNPILFLAGADFLNRDKGVILKQWGLVEQEARSYTSRNNSFTIRF